MVMIEAIVTHTLKNIEDIFFAVWLKKLYSKQVVLYRDKNAANKFIEAILNPLVPGIH